MILRFYGSHERIDELYERQQDAAEQYWNTKNTLYDDAINGYAYWIYLAQSQVKSARELLASKFNCARTSFRGPPWEDLQ